MEGSLTTLGPVALDIPNSMMHHDTMVDKELILAILAEGDSYGYEMIQRVHGLTENELKWTDSMLYPVLHRLEKEGWVSSYWQASPTGRKRKYYSVTEAGLAGLEERKRQWRIVGDALAELWARK